MILSLLAVLAGLALLVWSANRFVEGASVLAKHLSAPPLLIGMVIVGFGTSAPEMAVSTFAALEGNPGLAIGNAYGSNICNLTLILGTTALICPIAVHSNVVRRELPILLGVTGVAAWLLFDGHLGRVDAAILLGMFAAIFGWSVWQSWTARDDAMAVIMETELAEQHMSMRTASLWTGIGLVVLAGSSRLLVWGAVALARGLGVDDLIIGLTIVAIGTSLPELAASIVAARKGEPDLAIGNILGSNLFNTMMVVGIAVGIHPIDVPPAVLGRDMLVVGIATVALVVVCVAWDGKREIVNRWEGAALLTGYIAYAGWLAHDALPAASS